MSTFFFKANNPQGPASGSGLDDLLKKLKDEQAIEDWSWNDSEGDKLLSVETNRLSSEELKHKLRESGVDVDFSTPSAKD